MNNKYLEQMRKRRTWEKKLEESFTRIKFPEFGCQCDEGWYYILFELFLRLTLSLSKDEYLELSQIKEKFGGLRVYIKDSDKDYNSEIYNLIETFEKISFTVCEICSNKGYLYSRPGWLKTLCEKCAKEKGYAKRI